MDSELDLTITDLAEAAHIGAELFAEQLRMICEEIVNASTPETIEDVKRHAQELLNGFE